MKKHNNNHEFKASVFICNHCDREFSEKWKMHANIKKHDNYRCDKTLKSLDLKKKHIPLSHENVNPQLVENTK